jgi:hypothetical protein
LIKSLSLDGDYEPDQLAKLNSNQIDSSDESSLTWLEIKEREVYFQIDFYGIIFIA